MLYIFIAVQLFILMLSIKQQEILNITQISFVGREYAVEIIINEDPLSSGFRYEYNLQDHLYSNRVSFRPATRKDNYIVTLQIYYSSKQ